MAELTIEITEITNIHTTTQKIMELDPEAEDFKFRLQALIKRLIHVEKACVYQRALIYKDTHLFDDWLEIQCGTHTRMCQLPDEEIITWDVGPHKYKQNKKGKNNEESTNN